MDHPVQLLKIMISNVVHRSKLIEMGEGREGNDKISRHVELLERKIAKLARREKRANSNMELGEKILLEKLKMADGGEEDGAR